MNIIEFISENKIIAISRQIYGDQLLKMAEALCKGGVKMLEVTFDQADPDCVKHTVEAVKSVQAHFADAFVVGTGTVVKMEQEKAAKDAGSAYIISPNVDLEIIRATKSDGMVSIPGAMTPSEIIAASNAGADFVKLFPAGNLGPSYVKSIMAPINNVKLLAVGGVNEQNLPEFFKVGMSGAGIAAWLCNKALVEAGDFAEIERRASVMTAIAKEAGGKK